MKAFNKIGVTAGLLCAFLFVGAAGAEEGTEERGKLLEQEGRLTARIESLKQEQDYLLFQKTMYASDSKYLVLHIAARSAQLRYKNRILKDLPLRVVSGRIEALVRGATTLTGKVEDPKERNALVFGSAFLLQGIRPPALRESEPGFVRFALSKKDFSSLFYAVETGSQAYILP